MVARFFVLVAVAQLVAMATRGVAAQMSGVGKIISESLFNSMLPNRDNASCPAKGFYTYEAFITAASAFPEFGTSGSPELMKRELAAFFGQTSQETTGQSSCALDRLSWAHGMFNLHCTNTYVQDGRLQQRISTNRVTATRRRRRNLGTHHIVLTTDEDQFNWHGKLAGPVIMHEMRVGRPLHNPATHTYIHASS